MAFRQAILLRPRSCCYLTFDFHRRPGALRSADGRLLKNEPRVKVWTSSGQITMRGGITMKVRGQTRSRDVLLRHLAFSRVPRQALTSRIAGDVIFLTFYCGIHSTGRCPGHLSSGKYRAADSAPPPVIGICSVFASRTGSLPARHALHW